MDMQTLSLVGFVLAFAFSSFAQQLPLNEHQLGVYKGNDDAVRSVMEYCSAIDDSVQQRQPLIFAESKIDSTTESTSPRWMKFASKDDWAAAGKPGPLAFVWDRDGAIVRVTIVERVQPGIHGRVDYCYGTDTKLMRIRTVPSAPTNCQVLFPCRLISGHEFVLGGRWPAITDWVFTKDGTIHKLRDGKAVDDRFDPSYSLTASDLHLKKSVDLPFQSSSLK